MLPIRRIFAIALLVSFSTLALAQSAGSRFGEHEYVEYRVGEIPVILTAPHGGRLLPDSIADRTSGARGIDRNTLELTEAISDAFAARTGGKRPFVIISHLHRRKLDPNRDIDVAAQGDPGAEQAWREFHGFIEEARKAVAERFGRGLVMDIHGHGHPIQRIELGYALPGRDLDRSDAELNRPGLAERTAIRTTLANSSLSHAEVLRGPLSLGAELERRGVPAIPSPQYPGPEGGSFFSGGYITRRHGSMTDGGVICAIQLEHHFRGIRDNDRNRRAYSAKLVEAVDAFMKNHMSTEIGLQEQRRRR